MILTPEYNSAKKELVDHMKGLMEPSVMEDIVNCLKTIKDADLDFEEGGEGIMPYFNYIHLSPDIKRSLEKVNGAICNVLQTVEDIDDHNEKIETVKADLSSIPRLSPDFHKYSESRKASGCETPKMKAQDNSQTGKIKAFTGIVINNAVVVDEEEEKSNNDLHDSDQNGIDEDNEVLDNDGVKMRGGYEEEEKREDELHWKRWEKQRLEEEEDIEVILNDADVKMTGRYEEDGKKLEDDLRRKRLEKQRLEEEERNRLMLPAEYQNAREDFVNHAKEGLLNPFILEDIANCLKKIKDADLDFKEGGIMPCFNTLHLSTGLKHSLEKVNRAICRLCQTNDNFNDINDIDEKINLVKQDLGNDLSQEFHKYSESRKATGWETYWTFLNLPKIKTLDNSQIQKIQTLVENEDTESLHIAVVEMIGGEEEEEKLDDYIDDNSHHEDIPNLYTLLSQIIKRKPKKSHGILTYWEKDRGFFLGKKLILNDRESFKSVYGQIVTCEKHNDCWIFDLHDNTHIIIENKTKVDIVKTVKIPLLRTVTQHHSGVDRGDKVAIECSYSDSFIPSGEYIVDYHYHKELSGVKKLFNFGNKNMNFTGTEIALTSCANMNNNKPLEYSIYISDNYNAKHNLEVKRDLYFQDQSGTMSRISDYQLKCIILVKEKRETTRICNASIEKSIVIKDETDEALTRKQYHDEIEEIRNNVCNKLEQDKNGLLDRLIENLATNQLKFIDTTSLQESGLAYELEEICKKYLDYFDDEKAPEKILEEIALHANYKKFVDMKRLLEVSETMKLLKEAKDYREKTNGKDVCFFMGNTGAGKSTAVGALLGAKLKEYTNHVGDRVLRYKLKGDEKLDKQYPKIGQSLGQSETLYTTGYVPNDSNDNIGIADCPGFQDTRGTNYELCTNLSIDECVKNVKSIKSIVVVVPASYFMTDRANPILSLVATIQDKFPFAFTDDNKGQNSRVFMLITKGNQIQQDALKKIEDGTRIQALYEELNKELADDTQYKSEFERKSIERRMEVWRAIRDMWENEQVDVINVRDMCQRKELLKKYTESASDISKSFYQKAMAGGEMERKFGKCIEMATSTYKNNIFEMFLRYLPSELDMVESKIKRFRTKIEEREKKIEDNKEKILRVGADKNELVSVMADEVGEQQEKFLQRFQEIKSLRSGTKEKEKERIKIQISDKESLLKKVKKEISSLLEQIDVKEQESMNLITQSDQLGKGSHTIPLWEKDYRGRENEKLTINFYAKGVREKKFLEGNKLIESDYIEGLKEEHKFKDYEGVLVHEAYIDKEYKICPSDTSMRKQFEDAFRKGKMNSVSGLYQAKLDGEHFKCDLGMIADPSGRKVRYGFKTHWKKGQSTLPWIKISHTIPNSDYNEAAILSNEVLLKKTREDLVRLKDVELNEANKEKSNIEDDLMTFRSKMIDIDKELEEEEKKNVQEAVAKLETAFNKDIVNLTKEIEKEEKEIIKEREDVRNKERDAQLLRKEMRNLAVVIKTQWKTVELLKDLSDTMVEEVFSSEDSNATKSSTIDSCLQFVSAYNEKSKKLLDKCHKVLRN